MNGEHTSHEHLHVHVPQSPEMERRSFIRKMLGVSAAVVAGDFLAACGDTADTQQRLPEVPAAADSSISINSGATANQPATRLNNAVQINPPPPPPPTRSWNPGDRIIGGDPNYPYISFSFDDTPSRDVARLLMNTAEQKGIPGGFEFSVVGSIVRQQPDVMREIVSRGFRIVNHSMTHSYNNQTNINEIDPTNELIRSFTGYTPELFTGPGGGYTQQMLDFLASRGMAFLWTGSDMNDWTSPRKSKEILIANFTKAAIPGAHILLHGSSTHQNTAAAFPTMIDIARSKGLEVISTTEHMKIGNLTARALQLQATERQITDEYAQSGLIADLDTLDQEWIIELETLLEESTHLTTEENEFIKQEITSRKELVEARS